MKPAPDLDHLAQQLSAVQRCAYFALMTARKVQWPLDVPTLDEHRLDVDWFEPLAALNDRFTKWQDVMGATMRHTADLLAEPTEPYLRVLVFFEKQGVIPSAEYWQGLRRMRNEAAHEYDLNPVGVVDHFNALNDQLPTLLTCTLRLASFCKSQLHCVSADIELQDRLQKLQAAVTQGMNVP